jgi:hypothetical protein
VVLLKDEDLNSMGVLVNGKPPASKAGTGGSIPSTPAILRQGYGIALDLTLRASHIAKNIFNNVPAYS